MCDNNMDEMIEREWALADCRVAKYSWGFRVWASGGHCDIVPGNGDDMDACEAALDNGESPIASGWEDGAGHDVAAECERTSDEGEEGSVWGALSDSKKIAARIRAGLRQGRE